MTQVHTPTLQLVANVLVLFEDKTWDEQKFIKYISIEESDEISGSLDPHAAVVEMFGAEAQEFALKKACVGKYVEVEPREVRLSGFTILPISEYGPEADLIFERIANACHIVNKTYCELMLGDTSHLDWHLLSPEMRQSAVQGVIQRYKNPRTTPEESWKSWKQFKLDNGWKHGPVKDIEAKEHPNIVDEYNDLPLEERQKDELFARTCLAAFGYLLDEAVFTFTEYPLRSNYDEASKRMTNFLMNKEDAGI